MARDNTQPEATSHLEMVRPIGAGGFGVVYEAIDTRTGSAVAVKELDSTSPDAIARFKHEFRALSDLHHPNLVSLKELIEHHGRWLIVMELIPGTDFLEHVRAADNDNGYSEPRLRAALGGMVQGLRSLHAHSLLHRDLKPSNVRVRPDGRAVLLDFGLATSIDPGRQSTHAAVVGTIAYMAPEQAAARDVGPAADLYALGVCLFQALTGRLPFESDQPLGVLVDKQQRPAPRASAFAQVPDDLDELCAALLQITPTLRPSADDVLRILQGAESTPPGTSALDLELPVRRELFAGREGELKLLEQSLGTTHQGLLRIVLVEGESGVGKSELVLEFLRRAQQADPRFAVLRGRCYENEQVSYKAFDGCIDELARLLGRLSASEAAALLPVRAALLGQLFPVLRKVRAVAWSRTDGVSADPAARRLEAFAALAQLLHKLAEERTLVLVIDDLQWADSESFRLLSVLVEQTPLPPILLVATIRPRSELDSDVLAHVEALRNLPFTDVLPVVGLPREQARLLVRELLGPDTPERWLDLIADESHGHPLFMSELVHYTRSHDFSTRLHLTLEAALSARIERLGRRESELLELAALAARPYPPNVFARALGVDTIEEPARTLLALKLLRRRKAHELGVFHDRIRHTAVSLIARARLTVLHRMLAAALDSVAGVDPAEHARHWDLAGDRERALAAYERAVAHAHETLAFRNGAALAQRALELIGDDDAERARSLMLKRAHALLQTGYSAEAAALYERIAERSTGMQQLQVRSSAAYALLISNNVARGTELARSVLRAIGVRVPTRMPLILLRYAWDSLVLSVRGRITERRLRTMGEAAPDSSEGVALGIVFDLTAGMSATQPWLLPALTSQRARLALRIGSRTHIGVLYSERGFLRAIMRSLSSALSLFETSHKLLADCRDPEMLARQAFVEGSARIAGFDWAGAEHCLARANELCKQNVANRPWLLTSIRYALGLVWFSNHEFGRLAREASTWIAEARERNDAAAVAVLTCHGRGFVRHLVRDDPAAAHAELDDSIRPLLGQPFSFAHLGYMMSKTYTHLYEDSAETLRFLESFERAHADAFLLRNRMGREVRTMFRGLALLRMLAAAPSDAPHPLDKQLLRAVRTLGRSRSRYARAVAHSYAAQLDALRGRPARALARARAAMALVDDSQQLSGVAALVGLLEGGAAGRARYDAVVACHRAQGIVAPERLLSFEAPVLKRLHRRSEPAPQLLLSRYEVTGQLGRGGFRDMVAARDVRTGATVALKELVRVDPASLERFKRAYRALEAMHHPNLVELGSLFEEDGRWYIAMEHVEGEELLAFVRERGSCDPTRLRESFLGLCRGLAALHARGLVHRDVRPDNVIVTREGRPVLIDFGLVALAGEADEGASGNPAYAAPEQLQGALPAASADVYSLGVCLAEAITGDLPFGRGDAHALIRRKERGEHAPFVAPRGFEALLQMAERALAAPPAARPSMEALMGVLERGGERADTLIPPMEITSDGWFAGREDELELLDEASERSCDDGLVLVLVEGESGLGKSTLVHEFVRRTQQRETGSWVISGRCYESEQIAYKAVDGAIDQLAQRLRALPNPTCEALLPKQAALLAQLFPVLEGVPAIAGAPRKALPVDPAARKRAGVTCLVRLLEKLVKKTELLLTIDDLQWADADSFELLQTLIEHRQTLPFLVIATLRPAAELSSDTLDRLAALRGHEGTTVLTLRPLDEAATGVLAEKLLGAQGDAARALASESKGHPLFLRELIEHEKRGLAGEPRRRTLEDALRARIACLDPVARHLLALVALADRPHARSVFARAMERAELPREALSALLSVRLLRRGSDDRLACYHDRIKHVAGTLLPEREQALLAGKLAEALGLDPRADMAERGHLWERAGERERASEAYEHAGERALEALAFEQASAHFARALTLLGDVPGERERKLLIGRGHALVRAGRSADAVSAYARAAESAEGEQKVRLRIWVAQHLIQGARVEEGLLAARELLREFGVSLPRSERSALVRMLWESARLKVRGIRLKQTELSSLDELRLAALHGLFAPLTFVSYLTGSTVMVQYLRRALDAGEPSHAARALGYQALFRTMKSPAGYDRALFARARTLAERVGDPVLAAQIDYVHGIGLLARTEYQEAVASLTRAHEIVETHPGQPWLLNMIRVQLGFGWTCLGELRAPRRSGSAWLDEARARDDRCAIAALTGMGGASLRHLFENDAEAGLRELAESLAPWPDEPFGILHFGELAASGLLELARPPSTAPLDWIARHERPVAEALLMRVPNCRASWLLLRSRALLHSLASPRDARCAAVFAAVRTDVVELKRIGSPLALGGVRWFEALLAALDGRHGEAKRSFTAIRDQRPSGSPAGGLCARFALGLLERGESGRAQRDEVLAMLRQEGFREPMTGLSVRCSGLHLLA